MIVLEDDTLSELKSSYKQQKERFLPEESPFSTLFVDITHRCNMTCKNCYIPIRDLPDMPVDWLYTVLERLPRRTRIRLAGAEPTMREDLPEIISKVRALGHLPVVLTNGLKFGRHSYVKRLKSVGLRTVYLSLNGGLRDDLYETIDELACADRKLQALDNLLIEKMNVTTGTILVPSINDSHLPEFVDYLLERGVKDIHLRSVGAIGNYMKETPYDLEGLEDCLINALGKSTESLKKTGDSPSHREYLLGTSIKFQLTAWPDLGSSSRGRITPDGFVEPMFESIVLNEFSY
ncbi:GTP 3',8-cyclase [BD1-7 clade bacterium]|uniref:GTP 3',8-cyclase n=1 Tax=BD1-7 clade bacterium TaxID=2029982 RepID=A0A5S9PMJ2_9GAMM|nr:GTP 3',8-cyclase [BD1-7 clade bacterium]